MDINRAITYPFDDKDWLKKILIGGILMIIPIVNFIAVGYFIRVLKNLLEGVDTPLPEWDDFGGDFMRGLWPSIAAAIYAIPLGVLYLGTWIPIIGILFWIIAVVYLIAYIIAFFSMLMLYTKTGEFATFFAFQEIFQFAKEDFKSRSVAWLLIVVSIITVYLVSAQGWLGWVIAMGIMSPFVALFSMHLLAQMDHTPQTKI